MAHTTMTPLEFISCLLDFWDSSPKVTTWKDATTGSDQIVSGTYISKLSTVQASKGKQEVGKRTAAFSISKVQCVSCAAQPAVARSKARLSATLQSWAGGVFPLHGPHLTFSLTRDT